MMTAYLRISESSLGRQFRDLEGNHGGDSGVDLRVSENINHLNAYQSPFTLAALLIAYLLGMLKNDKLVHTFF